MPMVTRRRVAIYGSDMIYSAFEADVFVFDALDGSTCTSLPSLFFFQAEDGIRYGHVTGVQTCALPISEKDRRPAIDSGHEADMPRSSQSPADPAPRWPGTRCADRRRSMFRAPARLLCARCAVAEMLAASPEECPAEYRAARFCFLLMDETGERRKKEPTPQLATIRDSVRRSVPSGASTPDNC